MRETIVKILVITFALACITLIVIPSVMNDGAKVKNRAVDEYKEMFN